MRTNNGDAIFLKYSQAVSSAVRTVATEFIKSPVSFLYESDVQGLLFARLHDQLDGAAIQWPLRAKDWRTVDNGEPQHINPVKTEYPDGTKFDVALLDPGFIPKQKVWTQHVRLGIEIKLRQADGAGRPYYHDRAKLKRYAQTAAKSGRKFAGVCLIFCHREDDKEFRHWREHDQIEVDPAKFTPRDGEVVVWAVAPSAERPRTP